MRFTDLEINFSEGVEDPYIFKAIFMAGGPGSGKSEFRNAIFSGTGMKIIDPDEIRSMFLKLNKPGDYDVYGDIVRKQRKNYLEQRLGVIFDTTAGWFPSVLKTTQQFKSIGYDVGMVYVYAPVEIAKKRVDRRAEITGRTVPDDVFHDRHQGLQSNIQNYKNLFGDAFWTIDNSIDSTNSSRISTKNTSVIRQVKSWLRLPPSTEVAKQWIETEKLKKKRTMR
jgi:predicted ABC-type ATPase